MTTDTYISDEMVETAAKAWLKAEYYDCEPEMYGHDINRFYSELEEDILDDAKHNARAALEAIAPDLICKGMEMAAEVADEIGTSYGEDETGWLDCSETIAAAIRTDKEEV